MNELVYAAVRYHASAAEAPGGVVSAPGQKRRFHDVRDEFQIDDLHPVDEQIQLTTCS